MEARLGVAVPVLDHGLVRVIDYMGDDASIAQAARVSYGGGSRPTRSDRDLIRYLMRHRHTSPFEMCEIKLHVKLPIFVARQWIRHRTASVNEVSGRYSVLDAEVYIPRAEDLAEQSTSNRQGGGAALAPGLASEVLDVLRLDASRAQGTYGRLIDEGVSRELARIGLGLNTYTQWVWKVDLHNLLHFLALRMDRHAQREIRVYADAIAEAVREWVPMTWEAFEDYRLGAVTLSRQEVEVVRRRLRGEMVLWADSGLGLREWDELHEALPEVDWDVALGGAP
jgi:thymidylate synthase (FAD)